jgi:hypothetical protein
MDKLQLTGQKLGRVFNFRSSHLHATHLWCFHVKLPNLRLKSWPKQLLGSLLLEIALPDLTERNALRIRTCKRIFTIVHSYDAEEENWPLEELHGNKDAMEFKGPWTKYRKTFFLRHQ